MSFPCEYLLLDIEGTTTPISFVHEVLFPYSTQHLPEYLRNHRTNPEVRECLQGVQITVAEEQQRNIGFEASITQLLQWIDDDRKHPALKRLQGMVWRFGYETKQFTSNIYPDVLPNLKRWRDEGLQIGIYSSGSVAAQKLLFAHTEEGDLTPLFSQYFDTQVGHKKSAASYTSILETLEQRGDRVAFLSDVEEELDAASSAKILTIQVVRPGTSAGTRHPTAVDFNAVNDILNQVR